MNTMFSSGVLKSLMFFAICITLTSCSGGKEVERYDLGAKIDEHWPKILAAASDSLQLATFEVCGLLPDSGWNKVYTVAPYTTLNQLRKLNLDNFHKVKKHFRAFKYSDFNVGLLFVKDHEIVQYSISSIKLNFSETPFFTKEDCPGLQLETASKPDTTHFNVTLKGERLQKK